MKKQTQSTKANDIKREWHLIDAKGKILGRMATEIAQLLMGKRKPYFVPFMDCGDYVVLLNASKVEISGNKETNKKYTSYSGYPGGLRVRTYAEVKEKKPEDVVLHAVYGMLPKNKLRDGMMKRLHVFVGSEHKFEDKFSSKGGSA